MTQVQLMMSKFMNAFGKKTNKLYYKSVLNPYQIKKIKKKQTFSFRSKSSIRSPIAVKYIKHHGKPSRL